MPSLNITLINSELSEILNLIVKEGHAGAAVIWANKIFNSAVLYGPEQFQNYAVFQTSSGWWTVYVSQRATRKIYVHLNHYLMDEKAD